MSTKRFIEILGVILATYTYKQCSQKPAPTKFAGCHSTNIRTGTDAFLKMIFDNPSYTTLNFSNYVKRYSRDTVPGAMHDQCTS
ncbi:unnamed protein product [Allacma fusca]|uniref:Uncharacterized protein n=1 Tax=Allacma fusca TaxID=39272 RepID=A0A8J2KWV9_9HEXA|nr:unnamed protein product [Allacma fusca]